MLTEKKIKLLFIGKLLCILLLSCTNRQIKNETLLTQVNTQTHDTLSKEKRTYISVDQSLRFDSEKFGLLAKVYGMSYDTVYSIIREYKFGTHYAITGFRQSYHDSFKIVQSIVIDSIAQKFKLSKETTAQLIFSFEYEMVTKDEVRASAVQNYKDELGTEN